jgi:hypothetical protein
MTRQDAEKLAIKLGLSTWYMGDEQGFGGEDVPDKKAVELLMQYDLAAASIPDACPGCLSNNAPHFAKCQNQQPIVKTGFDSTSNQKALWPPIPNYLIDPIVFRDKNLGVALVAKWNNEQWIFNVSSAGKWCSVRKVQVFDPTFIEPLNKAPIASLPSQNENRALCGLCGLPMPEGEEMFKYHGYSGPCPKSATT